MPTVLLLAASPVDQDRLRLSSEVKQIKQALERSRNREHWTIESNEAVTVDDLRRALLDCRPTVVHFAGHGGGAAGLAFEDDIGETHAAQTRPLTRLLHQFKDSVRCVVLNACYSESQATEIRAQIDYVVGMSRGIDDESAAKFAVAFYDAVFAQCTFRQAFDIACTAIDLSNLPDHEVPVFLTGSESGGERLAYTNLIPQFEDIILAYLNAPYDQRYKFTTKGITIRDHMCRFYGELLHSRFDKVTVISTRRIDNEHWRVQSSLFAKGEKAAGDHYLRVRNRCIQVEWEASVGHWSMPPKTYLALGTSEPIIARVRASLGAFYHGDFREAARQYQCIDLRNRDGRTLHGYVPRHSAHGKQLIDLLSDGNRHDITITIGNVSDETEYPLIHSLLSTSWLLPDAT